MAKTINMNYLPVRPWNPFFPPDGPRVAVIIRRLESMIFGCSQTSLKINFNYK